MKPVKEENYDIICSRIHDLISLLEKGAVTLTKTKWDDIVKRITKLNQKLEILGRK